MLVDLGDSINLKKVGLVAGDESNALLEERPQCEPKLSSCIGGYVENRRVLISPKMETDLFEKRRKIANEILASEKEYVRKLALIDEKFYKPLLSANPVLSKEVLKKLFSGVEVVLSFNRDLVEHLEPIISNYGQDTCIGKVFLVRAEYFKIYQTYFKNHKGQASQKVLRALDQKAKASAWKTFCETVSKSQMCQPLPELLELPVQRIPQYHTLVAEYLIYTERSHPDYNDLQQALEMLKRTEYHIKEATTISMLDLEEQFTSSPKFISPSRHFIFQGTLNKVSRKDVREYEFFLFNDLLAYAKKTLGGKFTLHKRIPIDKCFMVDDIPETKAKHSFKILSSVKSFVVHAPSANAKRIWLSKFDEVKTKIENVLSWESHRSLGRGTTRRRVRSAGKHGRLHDQESTQQPVWQPDESRKDCSLCSKRFNPLTRRRHHCRFCGKLVCAKCSHHRAKVPLEGPSKKEDSRRMCNQCHAEYKNGELMTLSFENTKNITSAISPKLEENSPTHLPPSSRTSLKKKSNNLPPPRPSSIPPQADRTLPKVRDATWAKELRPEEFEELDVQGVKDFFNLIREESHIESQFLELLYKEKYRGKQLLSETIKDLKEVVGLKGPAKLIFEALARFRDRGHKRLKTMDGVTVYDEMDLKFERKLGAGNSASAWLVTIKGENRKAVLKIEKTVQFIDNKELDTMLGLPKHKNILPLLAVVDYNKNLCLLTPFCERGSLDKLHDVLDVRSPAKFRPIGLDIVNGIRELHKHNIIHRDISCRNIFVDLNNRAILADYGLARKMEDKVYYTNHSQVPWQWTAPEALTTNKFKKSADIWSVGVTFWEILSKGKIPYHDERQKLGINASFQISQSVELIREGKIKLSVPEDIAKVSPLLARMVKMCLDLKPPNRPSADRLALGLQLEKNKEEVKVEQEVWNESYQSNLYDYFRAAPDKFEEFEEADEKSDKSNQTNANTKPP